LYNIHFADSLHGGTVGGSWFYSDVMLTHNNFDSTDLYINKWLQLPSAIYYQNASTVWMSGWPAIIYKSIDGGKTFIENDTTYVTTNYDDHIHDFKFYDKTGYALSYTFILKIVDTLNTSVLKAYKIIDNIKISPNPASAKCKVSLSLLKPENIGLDIFSSNGISVLQVRKNLVAGKNEIILDVEHLKPGLYLLSIKSGSENHALKFIKQP